MEEKLEPLLTRNSVTEIIGQFKYVKCHFISTWCYLLACSTLLKVSCCAFWSSVAYFDHVGWFCSIYFRDRDKHHGLTQALKQGRRFIRLCGQVQAKIFLRTQKREQKWLKQQRIVDTAVQSLHCNRYQQIVFFYCAFVSFTVDILKNLLFWTPPSKMPRYVYSTPVISQWRTWSKISPGTTCKSPRYRSETPKPRLQTDNPGEKLMKWFQCVNTVACHQLCSPRNTIGAPRWNFDHIFRP